ncbi:MAG: hypothetical protein ACYC4L_15135 [Chloroflexota bacterium]
MSMEQFAALFTEKVAAWTLYHWAGSVFALGLAGVLSKALYEELRDSKSLVNRFFIICATVSVLLVAAAAYTEVANANGWRFF